MFNIHVMIVIHLVILSVFYNYVYRLEKISCECSKDWRRDYIKYFSMIYIISIIATLFSVYMYPNKELLQVTNYLNILVGLGNLVFIYAMISYVYKLKTLKCKCSMRWEREFMYGYTIVTAVFIMISIIINLFSDHPNIGKGIANEINKGPIGIFIKNAKKLRGRK